MSERTPEEIAHTIVQKALSMPSGMALEDMRKEIASAIAAERAQPQVPEGHVMLSDGRVVKVLGTLQLTADGCLPGNGADLWLPPGRGEPLARHRANKCDHLGMMYSTFEAAEAAQKEKP